jgi:tetratricopeptide (TPR) repeat protein
LRFAAANLNLGLLLNEQGRYADAESAFRSVMEVDSASHIAAYNLCVLLAVDRIDEAIEWCQRAVELSPMEPAYAYTLAFYLRESGDTAAAAARLDVLASAHPWYADAYILLADIHAARGDQESAESILEAALFAGTLSEEDRGRVEEQLEAVRSSRSPGN